MRQSPELPPCKEEVNHLDQTPGWWQGASAPLWEAGAQVSVAGVSRPNERVFRLS